MFRIFSQSDRQAHKSKVKQLLVVRYRKVAIKKNSDFCLAIFLSKFRFQYAGWNWITGKSVNRFIEEWAKFMQHWRLQIV